VSALEQEPPPLEVLVCDDGSTDATRAEFERWQAEEPRLRYLRIARNRGTPAPARNLGIASARGEWVAFLDDDDCWLPGKLALQAPRLAGASDVLATDAIRSNGQRYFRLGVGSSQPTRADIERANPIILSSAIVRRSMLLAVCGFDETRAIAGVEDYDLWLRLADRDARFMVLDAATVDYRDHGSARLSSSTTKTQRTLLRVRMRRLLRAPGDRVVVCSALREVYAATLCTIRLLAGKP
jgi:glycosyltransferase involved in cell wall biosynthesis